MKSGILSIEGKKKQLFVSYEGNSGKFSVSVQDLSESLQKIESSKLEELNGMEVDLEVKKTDGRPYRIRQKGEVWQEPITGFHNPYNFVPALPRADVNKEPKSELADQQPVGHSKYLDNFWSGTITVEMVTKTPLLIPDASQVSEDDHKHKTFPLRQVNYRPFLPTTSVKGMLRSAYEAITNSRLAVFDKHDEHLAYRMEAKSGLQMVPARIEDGKVVLYTGTTSICDDGTPLNSIMYAAWHPMYDRNSNQLSSRAVRFSGGDLPRHGEKIKAWVEKYKKVRGDGTMIFEYWKVRKIVRDGKELGQAPAPGKTDGSHHWMGEMKDISGYVCITNKNIDSKHDERVFFLSDSKPQPLELTKDLQKRWGELIRNYQSIHKKEIANNIVCSPVLKHSVWSRHVVGEDTETTLSEGTLCYAHVEKQGSTTIVKALYPVMVTRALFDKSPQELLAKELKPADSIKELSPADRVFGWASQKGTGAYKGQLRIGQINCQDLCENVLFKTPLTLSILAEPKPQQAKFYVAETPQGESLAADKTKTAGYKGEQGLRGRKVYPHHRNLPDQYWNPDKTVSIGDRSREYLMPNGEKSDQHRSITGWVEPGEKFTFSINVTNLSSVELGALLWLLNLPEDHYLRLGGGKPLGFGSVQLAISSIDLRLGQDWREFYSSLFPVSKASDENLIDNLKGIFEEAVSSAYPNDFEEIPFIKSFRAASKGFSNPLHYPRIQRNLDAETKSFEWFKKGNKSLDSLAKDQGFKYED